MRRHPKLIIFDLDGVIFKGQYLLRLSRRVGLFGHLRNLYRCLLYEMGVLPIDVLLREVYASFEGIRLAELRKAYDEMTLARGADQAVRELKARGAEVVIMSSGVPDLIVRDVADRLGADKGHGIEVGVAGEALSGEIGGGLTVADGKRIVIEKLMRDGGIGWEDVMVVADDINNLGVMMKAGISVGVNACRPVREIATYLVDGADLTGICGLLDVGDKPVDVWESWLQDARRKLVHVFAAGVPYVAALAFVPVIAALCVMIVVYSVSEWVRLNGYKVPLVSDVTALCIRRQERRRFVLAPVTLALGVAASLVLFSYEVATVTILIVAFSDSVAALVGRAWGTMRIPYNTSKSVQGSVAAFVVAYACAVFYFPVHVAVVAAIVSTLIESLPIGDDNVTVPIGTGLILTGMAG